MGKRQVRVIVVRKPVTVALLVLLTALMAGLIYGLSGRAYTSDVHPLREIASRLLGASQEPVSRGIVVAFLMPLSAKILLFVPWGFLMFLTLDSPGRSRKVSYLATIIGAVAFASAVYLWQQFLPTRVTSLPDSMANAAGAFAGAALAHARKSVRVRFDF